jgi:predicted ArsR family transcriptional regulator
MMTTTTVEQTWWSELDDQVLACLRDGPQSTRDLAHRLNLAPAGATSLLLMLAAEGKVRVTAVEIAETARSGRPTRSA